MRPRTVSYPAFFGLTDNGYRKKQPGNTGGRIPAHKIDLVDLTRPPDALVDLLNGLERILAGNTNSDQQLGWCAIHGSDVGKVDNGRFVSQVKKGGVHQVKMDSLDQQVLGDEQLLIRLNFENSCIVTYTFDGGWMTELDVSGEVIDQAKFAQRGQFSSFWIGFGHG